MRLLCCALLLLHSDIIWALSLSIEPELQREENSGATSNETDAQNFDIKALLDYESGLVFYKDSSIPACLVEKIPDSILDSSGSSSPPTFKIPIPSEEICIGGDNELLSTQPVLVSEPGLLFCSGLPILDITKLATSDGKSPSSKEHERQLVRRKRQSNGYYRSSAPTGEARAQSNWNPAHGNQASQAQVQGQVFGSGFFSGQAQSQNSGMSQSQVQLSGVGIRGQIASSSGNAQAQLSLGTGQGAGQASGLGEGPSNSQVQVSLAQREGEESMASASATSGGARAEVGGRPIGGSFGGIPTGSRGQYGELEQNRGLRNGGSPYGFTPGTRLFDDTGAGGTSGVSRGHNGDGLLQGDGRLAGGQLPGHGGAHNLQQQPIQGLSGFGGVPVSGPGIGDSRFSASEAGLRNGYSGGNLGVGRDQGPAIGSGLRQGLSTPAHGVGSGGNGFSTGIPYGQGISQNGGRTSQGGVSGGGQGTISPGATGTYGGNGGALGSRLDGLPAGSFQPGQIGSGGIQHGTSPGTSGVSGHGINGHYRTQSGTADGSVPQQHVGLTGGNGRYGGGSGLESNGVAYYGNGASAGGRSHAQSITPGAQATTYGLGQAQAQTVYFGNAGNGQYIPLRYDQSSQPGSGGSPGIHRFQDQQVGVGTAGQRQQLSQNGGASGIGTQGGLINGHRHTNLRNGHTSYTSSGNGATPTTVGQQPLRNGGGTSPSGDFQQLHTSLSSGTTGLGSGPQTTVTGSHGDGTGVRYGSDQTPLLGEHGSGVSSGQPSTVYTNGFGTGHGQQLGTHTTPSGYLPGSSTGYQNGHRQTTTSTSTNGRNGQTYVTNGYSNGGSGHQQVPTVTRNGQQTYRVNGNGHSSQQPATSVPGGQALHVLGQLPGQTSSIPGGHLSPPTADVGQDGFSPSYGISRPSQDDPDGRKCTIITFSCTIVIESNGRAKICRPNAVKVNGNGGGTNGNTGGNGGSKICCC